MSYQMQNAMLLRLKQQLIEKQYAHRFNELLHTNIRINKDDKSHLDPINQPNALLPSLSNTKLTLESKNKSHSAKKLPTKCNLDKEKHSNSTKRLANEFLPKDNSNKRIDFQDIIIKKQSITETKQTIIRTRLFSLKTPSKEQISTLPTHTKDTTMKKESTNRKADRQKRMSLHQFSINVDKINQELLLPLKQGKFDTESFGYKKMIAYISKIKNSKEQEYNKVQAVLEKIIKFVQKHKIISGNIEFRQLLLLASKKVLSNYQIVNTFSNKKQIIDKHKIPGLQFYTQPQHMGQNLAAQKITSLFKMVFSKRFCKNLSALMKKVRVIQKYWRICLLAKKTRRDILTNIERKIKKYTQLEKKFCEQWNVIKCSQRFEIHICSYSLQSFKRLTTKNLKQKENNQITRIFRTMETDISIIYVTPFHLQDEIIKYYQSILTFHSNRIQPKIYFVTPQSKQQLDHHFPITTIAALLYSPKAIKRIKQIIGQQYAYIVPSFPSVEYINLAAELNVPILGANQNLAKLYSTKSGALKTLGNISKKQKCPFQIPKAIVSVFSQKQLINSLSILIFKNKQVKTWYLKIEDQINSRGVAHLNINKIAFLREICSGSSQFIGVEETQMIKLIAEELTNKLKSRLKIVNKDIYANYDQYVSHFLTRGGIIQAGVQAQKTTQFSISFLIEPSGQFTIIGTYNKLQLGAKSINQTITFPSLLPNIDYEGITRNLYKDLWIRNKLFGYFTADFLYAEPNGVVYGIGLDCFLNQKTSSLFMVSFCTNSRYDKDRNRLINQKEEELFFTYCPSITLLSPPPIPTFFKNLKFENISFDLKRYVGTLFILLDNIESEQIGFITIEDTPLTLLQAIRKIIEYFCREYRGVKSSHDEIGLLKGAVTTALKRHQKYKGIKHTASNINFDCLQ